MNRRLEVVAEGGVMLALGLALAQVRLFQLPSGGSVSLGVLPVLVLAGRRGWRVGVGVGALLGLASAALKPFVVHPVQFFLDYPLAYASLGLAGLLAWTTPGRAAAATLLASLARLVCHVVAGAIWFAGPALTWQGALWAGFAYNILHIGPEALICAGIVAMLAADHPALVAPQGLDRPTPPADKPVPGP